MNAWDVFIWYHSIAMGSPLSIHSKKINIACMTSQWRQNCRFCPIWGFPVKYRPKLIFSQKSSNIEISPGFLFIKEGNDVSNIYCKIQDHTMKAIFKVVISNIAGLYQPPLTLCLWRFTLPQAKVEPQLYFIKMTAQDRKEIT